MSPPVAIDAQVYIPRFIVDTTSQTDKVKQNAFLNLRLRRVEKRFQPDFLFVAANARSIPYESRQQSEP